MFSLSTVNEDERFHKQTSSKTSLLLENSRLDIFSESILKKTEFYYDCVNLLLIESQSDHNLVDMEHIAEDEPHKPKTVTVPVLSTTSATSSSNFNVHNNTSLLSLDLTDDYDIFDGIDTGRTLMHDLDLLNSKKNLEKELSFIDHLFSRPLQEVS